jgi:L-alanine-DL-glutamate epimerase-like enolase superfamily enzyme
MRFSLDRDISRHCTRSPPRSVRPRSSACSATLAFTAYAKAVPVVDGAIDVPDSPGLGADPEEELIERFRA